MKPTEFIGNTTSLLKSLGLPVPKSPSDIPDSDKEFPQDLETLSVNEIIQKISIFNSLFSYASWLTAASKSEIVAYERELKTKEAFAYINADGGVTDKKNVRDADTTVIEIQNKLTESEIRYELLRSLTETYDKSLFVLSRALSVLQLDFKIMTHSDAWKELERTVAKKLGGRRIVRGDNFSQTMLDVEHPWLACDAKWRSSLATCVWFKKLVKDNEKIYGKGEKIPILILKEKGMRGELVVILIDDFIRVVNDTNYIIIPNE